MDHPAFRRMLELSIGKDALEKTIEYLAENLSMFLKKQETVLICFLTQGERSIGTLMAQAVQRCGAMPVIWEGDLRWKTLLKLAFSSRAETVIGAPLIILGLTKLANVYSIPLFIRNVVTAGYPCLDWMIDGIIKGLDCNTWGCFNPGVSSIVAGFSCGRSRGVHLRSDAYAVEITDEAGKPLPEGETGNIILSPMEEPQIRYSLHDRARLDTTPCPCGRTAPRLMDLCPGSYIDPDLMELGAYLQSWTSILDCRLKKGPCGLEMELVTFPGEKLPQLPTCARLNVRPWDPEHEEPFRYDPEAGNA